MTAAASALVVPIRLDALSVGEERTVAVRRAPRYSYLPFFDAARRTDLNADTAFLSESIVPQPFDNVEVPLGTGLHLHWAMPDALTRGHHDAVTDALVFPELPTRWLVARHSVDGTLPERRWIVESDYLAAPGVNRRGIAIDIPYRDDESEQPYRYLGRSMPFLAWRPRDPAARYLSSLTALGFGDPTFAAYYPSCFSVFGFRDPDPPADLSRVRYLVLGWYPDDPAPPGGTGGAWRDPLRRLAAARGGGIDPATLRERFGWLLDEGTAAPERPDRLLCRATIDFAPEAASAPADVPDAPLQVTLADTPGEALSAYLARTLVAGAGDALGGDPMSHRARLEAQLDALQHGERLDERAPGLRERLDDLRHRARFAPVDGSSAWRVRRDAPTALAAAPPDADPSGADGEPAEPDLPDAIVVALARVNALQDAYERGRRRVHETRRQLFADWYKYMVALYPPEAASGGAVATSASAAGAGPLAYPDADRARLFIERRGAPALAELVARVGRTGYPPDGGREPGTDSSDLPSVLEGDDDSIAARLVAALAALRAALARHHAAMPPAERERRRFVIEPYPDRRFWEATEPAVLISGEAARPTDRHGRDGELPCTLHPGALDDEADVERAAAELAAPADGEGPGHRRWRAQPWNPVSLEWKVELYSLQDRAQRLPGSESYSRDYVTANFEAPVLTPELQVRPGRGTLVRDPSVYTGSAILTPQADTLLIDAIRERLVKRSGALARRFDELGLASTEERLAHLGDADNVERLLAWFERPELSDPTVALTRALAALLRTPSLAQSLGGFNAALTMHRDSAELPPDDPINFAGYRGFAGVVRTLLGDGTRLAPSPQNAFNPIRAGALRITGLKLVDTFGRARELDVDAVGTTSARTTPGAEHLVRLPPRLAQPARLDFRWLAASEAGGGTASTARDGPVCGWLLPNGLDRSVVFHDGRGRALGLFKAGRWREPPDSDAAVEIADIGNPHLRRVARFVEGSIAREGEAFVETFIAVLEDALENIEPDPVRTPRGAAALTARPLAVVRAAVDLQLAGSPAVSQAWDSFAADLDRTRRTTAEVARVRFPVRLGEYGRLDDGLIGYWLERPATDGAIRFADDGGTVRFYSPQSDYIDTASLETRYAALDGGAINFHQSIDDPPQCLTLLVDPGRRVHATVGIVPRKAIDIPEEQYAAALDAIEIGFLHAPLLTAAGRLELPLRPLPDLAWSWVERRADRWEERRLRRRLRREDVVRAWEEIRAAATASTRASAADGETLWQTLLDPEVRWIEPSPDEDGRHALVPEEDERRGATLPAPFAGREELVGELLTRVGVGLDPVRTEASFDGPTEIRDGWLKLRRTAPETD